MEARRKKRTGTRQQTRTVNFHAQFTPAGPDVADQVTFTGFFTAALNCALEQRNKERSKREADLVQQKARLEKLINAKGKVMPILVSAMGNRISAGTAARRIKNLVPDKVLRQKLAEIFSKALMATPEQIAKQHKSMASREAKLARDEADLQRSGRLLKWRAAILGGLSRLATAAMSGDRDAAKHLAEAAADAAALLLGAEKKQPKLLRPVARGKACWPVLASDEAGWEKSAQERIAKLELGADLQWFKVRFRKARGTDANLPARLWARAAVRTIEETHFRFQCLRELLRQFGSTTALNDYCFKAGWNPGRDPQWLKDVVRLPPFSDKSLVGWKPLIRKMIREQLPGFHTRPEWVNQRNTAEASGRNTHGEVQNAILDDIMSALQRLAPCSEVPKPVC